jgi:hypothetical protein
MESASIRAHESAVGSGGQQSVGAAQVREGWTPADPAPLFLLGIGNSGGSEGLVEAGGCGWFGLATAATAWYASFAAVVNSTFGRTVLPVRPLGP